MSKSVVVLFLPYTLYYICLFKLINTYFLIYLFSLTTVNIADPNKLSYHETNRVVLFVLWLRYNFQVGAVASEQSSVVCHLNNLSKGIWSCLYRASDYQNIANFCLLLTLIAFFFFSFLDEDFSIIIITFVCFFFNFLNFSCFSSSDFSDSREQCREVRIMKLFTELICYYCCYTIFQPIHSTAFFFSCKFYKEREGSLFCRNYRLSNGWSQ